MAKNLYEAIRKRNPECKIEYKGDEFIDQYNGTEYRWNVAIKTAVKVRHDRPDLVISEIDNKICHFIQFSCPTDVNVIKHALGIVPKDMHENIRHLGFKKKESNDSEAI